MVKKIIAAGPVIVKDKKLLLTLDNGDNFFKIPGGKPEFGESLEECVLRELKEETGFEGEIEGKLTTIHLTRDPDTGEETDIFLYHFSSKIKNFTNFDTFEFNNHKVIWMSLDNIQNYKLTPNIKILFERGELK